MVDRLPFEAREMDTPSRTEAAKLLAHVGREPLPQAWQLAMHELRRGEIAGKQDPDRTLTSVTSRAPWWCRNLSTLDRTELPKQTERICVEPILGDFAILCPEGVGSIEGYRSAYRRLCARESAAVGTRRVPAENEMVNVDYWTHFDIEYQIW